MNPEIEIDSLDPFPGRLSWKGGRLTWDGPKTWTVKHGEARAFRVAGCLAWVEGALSQSGDPGRIVPGDPVSETWRRRSPDGTWVHGTLTLATDGIAFVEYDTPPPAPKWTIGSLPADLAACHVSTGVLSDDSAAAETYSALCGNLWTHVTSGKDYLGSWMKAAEVVSSIRGRGEVPCDFLMDGDEGEVSDLASDLLKETGWKLSKKAGGQDMRQARRLLETCAVRPMSVTPIWYGTYAFGLLTALQDVEAFAHELAYSGRMEYHEWCGFWERFPFPV